MTNWPAWLPSPANQSAWTNQPTHHQKNFQDRFLPRFSANFGLGKQAASVTSRKQLRSHAA